ncbi:hypothetical protein RSOLAG1IB_02950 [Rhizoctonia solani AG-1 IB]|uniref:RING-type domain-containing protein n=1 Tax=Thanatephorus cucumeris (strain AG1-IB / isolate 7/3/14) TaxID=1108050 RepID=A0A0B7FKK7_THACB|nr:hypothetical protein RSOLAG1IB_02950 [Rhizoctonia solani AG-1 IB]
MSRPRPPLHDPYGLLRPPPPEVPASIYSAASNALASTTSLPLPNSSPNRRNRQRGISPSRTQHGEEYDDQPYLTNVVRHHGQVTLVPPVNQGRARKARRRRNPEASASVVSLVDTLNRPGSSSGPSRAIAEPQPRSPRRPRHGSETRAVSNPDVRASPYPDYPPPSFEEVLALDRNNASSTPTSPPTNEPAPDSSNNPASPMFLISAPPSLSDPAHNSITTATPWEHDRLLGLSLEERVRREYERNLRQHPGSRPALETNHSASLSRAASPAPIASSPTATSVTASNFLTPQNLSPSPSGVTLPLSTTNSPKANDAPQGSSPPPVPSKSPELIDTPIITSEALGDDGAGRPVRNAPTESQAPRNVELDPPSASVSSHFVGTGSAHSARLPTQEVSSNSEIPLTSLLFTTRLRLDGSPERIPMRESCREPSPIREVRPRAEAGASQAAAEGSVENVSQDVPFPRVHSVCPVVPPQGCVLGSLAARPVSPFENASPPRSPVRPQRPRPESPATPAAPSTLPTPVPVIAEPPQLSLSVAARRPPPPPPPRPRQRQVGSGVAGRISVYENLLANAPKVPPPIPPRPRPRSQTTLDNTSTRPTDHGSNPASTGAESSGPVQQVTASDAEVSNVPKDTHTVIQSSTSTQTPRPPTRPASAHTIFPTPVPPPRPSSMVLLDSVSPVVPQRNRLGSRPLPTPDPSRSERPMSMSLQVQLPLISRVRSASIELEASGALEDAHTESQPSVTTRPGSHSRSAGTIPRSIASPLVSPHPQSNRIEPEPLASPQPQRPERPVSAYIQAQALVPARVGLDGKLEMIPDAEVIWLDESNTRNFEHQNRPSDSTTFNERSPPLPSVPLEDTSEPPNRDSEANPFDVSFPNTNVSAPILSRQSSTTSSVYQPISPGPSRPQLSDAGPSSSTTVTTATDSTVVSPPAHLADDFEYTDLDLLISRLEENESSRQGANYEQFLTVGEVLGPAHPPAPRPDLDLNVGLIEIQRRRVMKDGRVKLKLSLMGVSVDKCGICLTQFKNNESAVLLPCLHSFHTNCIMSWFVRQDAPACPHCRTPVTQ